MAVQILAPGEQALSITFFHAQKHAAQRHGFVTIITNATAHGTTLIPIHYSVDDTLSAIDYDRNETNILLPKKYVTMRVLQHAVRHWSSELMGWKLLGAHKHWTTSFIR